jgi:hypothetical protein
LTSGTPGSAKIFSIHNPEKLELVQYVRLTKRSGLEQNADKTEILNLNSKGKDKI